MVPFVFPGKMDVVVQQQTLIVWIRYSFVYFSSRFLFFCWSHLEKSLFKNKCNSLKKLPRVVKRSWKHSKQSRSLLFMFIQIENDFWYFFYVSRKCHGIKFKKERAKANKQSFNGAHDEMFVWFHLFRDDIEWLLHWCVKRIKDVRQISIDQRKVKNTIRMISGTSLLSSSSIFSLLNIIKPPSLFLWKLTLLWIKKLFSFISSRK
jgi:hypothetical protein